MDRGLEEGKTVEAGTPRLSGRWGLWENRERRQRGDPGQFS